MKPSSPTIDVNLAELDQIIDEGMRAPLSETNGQKLKNALHALVERAAPRWRTTEKTRAVFDKPPSAEAEPEKPGHPLGPASCRPAPVGHGRNGAARFPGAHKVVIPQRDAPAWRSLSGVRRREGLPSEAAQNAGADRGTASVGSHPV